jgi:3-hydroxybutyryl-CoA dehydrogenase
MRTVGVVGAGLMGSGIAESVAIEGLRVIAYEPEIEPLHRSHERIAYSLDKAVTRGKLEAVAAATALSRMTHTTDVDDLLGCEIVIEAVTEDVAVKAGVFRELDELLDPDVILASNTSSIPITTLAAATAHPQRVLGLHFFSPVPVMSLVEIVAGHETSAAAIASAEAFAREIGKHPIRTKDRAGFLVNMLLVPYIISAIRLFDAGFATREDIDDGMVLGCGHPMGPLTLCDFIGLDVIDGICASLHDEYQRDEYAAPPLLRRMVVAGCLGRKTGQGFYKYPRVRVGAPA